jgi:hypothetical protein
MGEEDKNKEEDNFDIEGLLKRLSDVDMDDGDNSAQRELQSQTLVSKIEEYLSPFVVIGYDVNGNCVAINNAQNQRDIDGLSLSIGRYMATQPMGKQSRGIGDMFDEE